MIARRLPRRVPRAVSNLRGGQLAATANSLSHALRDRVTRCLKQPCARVDLRAIRCRRTPSHCIPVACFHISSLPFTSPPTPPRPAPSPLHFSPSDPPFIHPLAHALLRPAHCDSRPFPPTAAAHCRPDIPALAAAAAPPSTPQTPRPLVAPLQHPPLRFQSRSPAVSRCFDVMPLPSLPAASCSPQAAPFANPNEKTHV